MEPKPPMREKGYLEILTEEEAVIGDEGLLQGKGARRRIQG